MDWWTSILPVADAAAAGAQIHYQNQSRTVPFSSTVKHDGPDDPDRVMLIRPRKSRIYFMRSLFDYPLSLSTDTLRRFGWRRALRIFASYVRAQFFRRRPEISLEDFLINRFGKELYLTFFKSYTEKVWGVRCDEISAAWGAQRIKGLSLRKAVADSWSKLLMRSKSGSADVRQRDTETSLIEQFLYPKYGPGQLWERVAELVKQGGGEVRLGWRVVQLHVEREENGADRVISAQARTPQGDVETIEGDYFFSTMPVCELIRALDASAPAEIQTVSDGLVYRDFITVGLLVDRLLISERDGSPIIDTWIYIQEPGVLVGRLQIFNHWSPYLVADPSKMWIGLEYFCYDSDPLWHKSDAEIVSFAVQEIASVGILNADEVRDSCVIRVPKAYPAYFGTYERFDEIVRYTERFENLFLVGRNGMHRYNNQDHSMLTAMVAVENILAGITTKQNLWRVNTEQEYHEQQSSNQFRATPTTTAVADAGRLPVQKSA